MMKVIEWQGTYINIQNYKVVIYLGIWLTVLIKYLSLQDLFTNVN